MKFFPRQFNKEYFLFIPVSNAAGHHLESIPSSRTRKCGNELDLPALQKFSVIEHPLIALQRCISLRYHTSCKESATPAEEIPELSAGQEER